MDRELLIRAAASVGVTVGEEEIRRLEIYARLLVEWNEKMNLTAVTDPAGIALKHFADSLSLLPLLPPGPFSLIDVGTGAGFPGVPLAVCRGDIRLTLLDSLQKRMRWLETEALPALSVEARFLPGRAEDFAQDCRGKFDVVASRAVARLNLLCELCLPFVHKGGYFLAMKGAEAQQELHEAARAIRLLGGSFERSEEFVIGGVPHRVVVIGLCEDG